MGTGNWVFLVLFVFSEVALKFKSGGVITGGIGLDMERGMS